MYWMDGSYLTNVVHAHNVQTLTKLKKKRKHLLIVKKKHGNEWRGKTF